MAHSHILVGADASVAKPLSGNLAARARCGLHTWCSNKRRNDTVQVLSNGLHIWSFRTEPRNEGNGIEVLASCSSGMSRHHLPRLSCHLKART
jgi:hypothetical protein